MSKAEGYEGLLMTLANQDDRKTPALEGIPQRILKMFIQYINIAWDICQYVTEMRLVVYPKT